MIETPALLTIKRPDRRPTDAQIAAFQDVPTSFVVDAMQGGNTLHRAIRPIGEGRDLRCVAVGPALTVESGPADVLGVQAALPFVSPGDVVVNAVHGHQACAAVGDRVCGMHRNNGAVGLITDGPARDYDGIVKIGLPLWCTGLTPNTPYCSGPARIGLPIQIGGQQVETGDMIVADLDGVVVVPFAQIDAVRAALVTVVALEEERDAQVDAGLKIPASIQQILDSDQVRYV